MLAGLVMMIVALPLYAQEKKTQKVDTVIVPLANTTRVILTIEDRKDLEILRHYNFQDLFQDIIKKLEATDTSKVKQEEVVQTKPKPEDEDWGIPTPSGNENADLSKENENDAEWNDKVRNRRRHGSRTWQSFNFDLGTNNYLSDGKFPDASNAPYAVRPWGSWYVGLSSIQKTRVSRNFFLEWGLGMSWYNFKFQDDNVLIQRTETGTQFLTDLRDVDHIKSKLSVTYINASFVPVLDFGDNGRKARVWDGYGSDFRIGVGPYVGYRVSSRSKLVYEEDGDREKDKNRDSFYLNNLRYGLRLQIGIRSTDLFFNYDFNELFSENKGPKLNAFSFGVIL